MTYPIPDVALARHIACVGETGSGKTHDTKTLIEHVVAQGYRVCVLDTIKSDWWGITSSASGKRPGLPFTILGGPRGHVPLHSNAGKAIGQLVGEGKLPHSIIDMADFEPGGPQRFFEHFAQALWKHTKGVVYLVIEEAHEIAPKERAGFGAENMAIHWAKKLATGSRTKGIRLIIASQRTQAVHNALLGSCGTLMAHSLSLPADQKPIIDWLKANVRDQSLQKTIESDLAFLPTGTAWVCCAKDNFFKKIHFPKIATFDNTATPDKDADDFDVATASVDAEALRGIIGSAVKDAEANDPKHLRARIGTLERELAAAGRTMREQPPVIDTAAIESKAFERGYRSGFDEAVRKSREAYAGFFGRLQTEFPEVAIELVSIKHESVRPAPKVVDFAREASRMPERAAQRGALRAVGEAVGLAKAERTILTALAQHGPCAKSKLAILTCYAASGGGYNNALGRLRSLEYITTGEQITLTNLGAAHAPDEVSQRLPTGRDLIEWWLRNPMLGKAERVVLQVLSERSNPLPKEEIAARAGYAADGGGFNNALGRLRTLGLISGGRDEIVASEHLRAA